MAVRNEQVLPSIQIDVQEERCPGPFGSGESGKLRNFGVGSVAAIEEECVHAVLRPIIDEARDRHWDGAIGLLSHADAATAAEHIEYENVVVTVAVNIGEIDAHGKEGELPKRQARQGAKFTVTLVDPDAVRRIEIVADVYIRQAIAVDVAEHD